MVIDDMNGATTATSVMFVMRVNTRGSIAGSTDVMPDGTTVGARVTTAAGTATTTKIMQTCTTTSDAVTVTLIAASGITGSLG